MSDDYRHTIQDQVANQRIKYRTLSQITYKLKNDLQFLFMKMLIRAVIAPVGKSPSTFYYVAVSGG